MQERKILMTYSKEEIIDGLLNGEFRFQVPNLLKRLWIVKSNSLLKEESAAIRAENEAEKAYFDFLKSIEGKEKSENELKKRKELFAEVESKRLECDRISYRVEKFYRETR